MAAKKLKVASVIPPHVSEDSSYRNLAKVYSYISRKYNVEITIILDDMLDYSYPGLKVRKIPGFDSHCGLYKVPFFLGLPRMYYPTLVEELKKYDVIESSTPEFYIYGLQSYKAAKKWGKRLVFRTSQSYYGYFLFPWTKCIALHFARKAYEFADSICFANPDSLNANIRIGLVRPEWVTRGKAMVIGHAVDEKIFFPRKKRHNPGKIRLITVGGLMKVKGHQYIIKALRILHDRGIPNIELHIIGRGPYRKNLVSLAEELGLGKRVKFLGGMSHHQLAQAYNQADIFVLANMREVTPAVNEAMLCGLPVVAARCGGIDFVLPTNKHGLISSAHDSQDLARNIAKLVHNPKLGRMLAKKARRHILNNFTIEKVGDRLFSAYRGKSS